MTEGRHSDKKTKPFHLVSGIDRSARTLIRELPAEG